MSQKELSNIREKGLESRQLQRRVRHLQFIIGRNIEIIKPVASKGKGKVLGFSLYFSLHSNSNLNHVLYESEEVHNSVNPNWRVFYPNFFCDKKCCTATSCILCLWSVQNGKTKLIIKWDVDLSGLRYIGDQQKPLSSQELDPNTLIFGMFGGYFTLMKENKVDEESGSEPKCLDTLLKVKQSTVKWTYQKNSLLRVYYMLKALYETKQEVARRQEEMHQKAREREILSGKFTKKESLLSRIAMLKEELTIQRESLASVKNKLSSKSQTVSKRENDLAKRYESLEQNTAGLKSFHSAHIARRESLLKVGAQLDFRRRQLVAELSYIYPIVEIPGNAHGKRELAICDIRLPDTESFFGEDEETLAVALGYTCHLVAMVARFLELPLRYPMQPMGSRSTVLDLVTNKFYGKLEREFPLHAKSKEKYLFHYGLFLLNKNIGQLRYHNGIGTADLRKTLPNLKQLFENKFGVKIVYKKEMELLGHGFERTPIPRKGTGSSQSELLSSPNRVVEKSKKEDSQNDTLGLVKRKFSKKHNNEKDGSGLPSAQKHSQAHKFINRRGKRSLMKTASFPDSSSSDNLMEVPFEELLMKSNKGRASTLNEADVNRFQNSVSGTGIQGNSTKSSDIDVMAPGCRDGHCLDEFDAVREEDPELFRTVGSLDAASPFEEMSATNCSHIDDISCIIHKDSLANDATLNENNDMYNGVFSRQLSDVLVIPNPFNMDLTVQHLQSQVGSRL